MEKGYLHWKADIVTEFDPFETGLGRLVGMEKAEFIGREALLTRRASGPQRRLVTLAIQSRDAPAHGGASVMVDGAVKGTVTSGDWGHRLGMNLAYAFVDPALATPGTQVTIDIIGRLTPAEVIPPGPYDPDHANVRA